MKAKYLIYSVVVITMFFSCSRKSDIPSPAHQKEAVFKLVISTDIPFDTLENDFSMVVAGATGAGNYIKYTTSYPNATYDEGLQGLIINGSDIEKYGTITVTSSTKVYNTGLSCNVSGSQNPAVHIFLSFYSDDKKIYSKTIVAENTSKMITFSVTPEDVTEL